MFAIPLFARGERAPLSIRVAASSGLCMTLLYVIMSVYPILDVENPAAFALKISGVVLGINAVGLLYFARANRNRF